MFPEWWTEMQRISQWLWKPYKSKYDIKLFSEIYLFGQWELLALKNNNIGINTNNVNTTSSAFIYLNFQTVSWGSPVLSVANESTECSQWI